MSRGVFRSPGSDSSPRLILLHDREGILGGDIPNHQESNPPPKRQREFHRCMKDARSQTALPVKNDTGNRWEMEPHLFECRQQTLPAPE